MPASTSGLIFAPCPTYAWGAPEQAPGRNVRTRIVSAEQGLDIEVDIGDPHGVVKRIIVVTGPPGSESVDEELEFTIEHRIVPGSEPKP